MEQKLSAYNQKHLVTRLASIVKRSLSPNGIRLLFTIIIFYLSDIRIIKIPEFFLE